MCFWRESPSANAIELVFHTDVRNAKYNLEKVVIERTELDNALSFSVLPVLSILSAVYVLLVCGTAGAVNSQSL